MSILQPIWQHLPVHFKEDVVSYLDYNSKCQLRVCSKEEKNLVDSRPLTLDYLEFNLTESLFQAAGLQDKPAKIIMRDINEITSKFFNEEDAIDHFLLLLSNQKLIVNYLSFNVWGLHRNGHQFKFFKKLHTKMQERNLKLKVRNVIISTIFRHKDQFIEFVQNIDDDCLVSMKLSQATQCQLRELSSTNQWQRVKELKFETRDLMEPEWLFHVEKLEVEVKRLNSEAISAMMQNLMSKQFPRGSYFSISTIFPIINSRASILSNILKNLPIDAKNDRIDFKTVTDDPIKIHLRSPLHTQKIEMTDQNNVFLIILCESNFSGIVCNVNSFEDDLKKFLCE